MSVSLVFDPNLTITPIAELAVAGYLSTPRLGQLQEPCPNAPDRPKIDEFLPTYDVSASYEIPINAPASVVYSCLLRFDFSQVWLVRFLLSVRTGKRLPRNRDPVDLLQRFNGTGFVILNALPVEEIVIGVAGKFWRPDGGRCLDLTESDFGRFSRPGHAKVAWNFRLKMESPERTVLSTETRIKCFGQAARWKFRMYWSLIAPFSGLIRKAILKRVKIEAQSSLQGWRTS